MADKVERVIQSENGIYPALNWASEMIKRGLAGGDVVVTLGRKGRTLSQNAKMWPMLTDVSKQKQLCINGQMVWAAPDDWKSVFTASLQGQTRMAMGLDGGLVMLGMSTSKMKKTEFCELIELIYTYGAENDIKWSDQSQSNFEDIRK